MNTRFCTFSGLKHLATVLALGFGMSSFVNQALSANAVNLSLAGVAAPNPVIFGDQFAFSITVTNSGTSAASNVVITDQLPAQLNFASAFPSQGTYNASAGFVTCHLGDMAAGSIATVLIYVSPQAAGNFSNPVSVSADETNLNSLNSTLYIPVNVYVPAAPVLNKQPVNQLLNLGGLLNLVVGVLNSPNAHFQWRLNGANIPGATNALYLVSTLLATDGGSYTVVVSDQYGVTTSQPALITLANLLSLPASDNFATRGPLGLLGTTTGNNIGATSEPGEPLHAGVPGGKSVWFKWTPLLGGVAKLSTAGSSFDTLLAVYTGNSLTNLTPVVSDDDQGGYYTSEVTFNAVAGTTYSIAVDGAYGAEGNIVLTSSEQLLTAPVPQITAQPANQVVGFGGTAQFSVVASGNHLSFQWFCNGQAVAGASSATLQITNVSSAQVGLYYVQVSSGNKNILSQSATLQISVTDGNVNANLSAMDKFQSVAYPISGGAQANIVTKSVTKFANLKSGTTRPVAKDTSTSRGYSSTQVFTTYGSQTQSSEPNNCDNPGGSSAWTSITAPDNGLMTIDTFGSNFRTIVGAYTGNGSSFSSLQPVACDVGTATNGTSNGAVSFAATSNTVYYISVDGYNGAYGKVVLNWSLNTSPAIVSQPNSLTAAPGATVSLNASASGHATPGCQWLFNGSPIPGCTNGTLTITNFQFSKVGNYQMKATNALGWVTTTPASVLLNNTLHLDSCGLNCTNHHFQMRLVGIANTNYTILASTDMKTWTPIATNKSPTGLWVFSDGQSTNFAKRFYRVVTGP